eukprot:1695191-Pleurochrysis_carterae.AAC.2
MLPACFAESRKVGHQPRGERMDVLEGIRQWAGACKFSLGEQPREEGARARAGGCHPQSPSSLTLYGKVRARAWACKSARLQKIDDARAHGVSISNGVSGTRLV